MVRSSRERSLSKLYLSLFYLWLAGCAATPPQSTKLPPATAQELMKAKKVVVEIYGPDHQPAGSGFIIDIIKNKAYILTTSPQAAIVNVFYHGDFPAKLLYQTPLLTLLSIEGIDLSPELLYYLDSENPKTKEALFTMGKDWKPADLTYLESSEDRLLLAGHLTKDYYGSPLIKGNKIIGILSKSDDSVISAIPIPVIQNFLKSLPEILANNEQRRPPAAVNKSPPKKTFAAKETRKLATSSAKPISEKKSLPATSAPPAPQKSKTVVPSFQAAPSNFQRPPPAPEKKSLAFNENTTSPVLINAMCLSLGTNDTLTFRRIAKFIKEDHPLFYLTRNLETAIGIEDKKSILQHSIKFLFEAFILSKRTGKSACTQELIRRKNQELTFLNKASKNTQGGPP